MLLIGRGQIHTALDIGEGTHAHVESAVEPATGQHVVPRSAVRLLLLLPAVVAATPTLVALASLVAPGVLLMVLMTPWIRAPRIAAAVGKLVVPSVVVVTGELILVIGELAVGELVESVVEPVRTPIVVRELVGPLLTVLETVAELIVVGELVESVVPSVRTPVVVVG